MFSSLFLLLLLQARGGDSFSNGAPMSACKDDMVPRHGFSPQQGIDGSVNDEGQIILFEYKYHNPIVSIITSWPQFHNKLVVLALCSEP